MNKATQACEHFGIQIGSDSIVLAEVERAAYDFYCVLADFNIRGQVDEISHPGFLTEFKFCPSCGSPVSVLIEHDALYYRAVQAYDCKGRAVLIGLKQKELDSLSYMGSPA